MSILKICQDVLEIVLYEEKMMKIVADSSTLLSTEEGKALDITIIPACAVINGEVYRDYEDIDSESFLKLIEVGGVPTSSQPSIGDVLEVFEDCDEEILYLSIGDGLSGTYQTAVGAKNSLDENEHIHVVDTKTLAAAQRYLVRKALRLRAEGVGIREIKEQLQESIESSVSFVIPVDFDFLKRSGRLTAITAKIGGMIKLVPVMTQTADKKRITPFAIKRSNKKAVEAIIGHLQSMGVDENYVVSVCHGGAEDEARAVCDQIRGIFPGVEVEMYLLAPALITHGGPGCIVVQAIRK